MKSLFKRITRWLWSEELEDRGNLRRALGVALREVQELRDLLPNMTYQHQIITKQIEWIRAQLMNVRVAQAERPRVGWEVMAYLPEEVIAVVKNYGVVDLQKFRQLVADVLIRQAIEGILHVNAQGKVNALVFAPMNINGPAKAPEWCQVIFEGDTGKLKLSERLPRLKSEQEQMRDAMLLV